MSAVLVPGGTQPEQAGMGLPADRRLRRGSDVTHVVRAGRRSRVDGLVVHATHRAADVAGSAGPRIAFVAPRAVGSSVVRNRTRRRLQAQLMSLVSDGDLAVDVDIVVRLLPAATTAPSHDLGRQLRIALHKAGILDGRR